MGGEIHDSGGWAKYVRELTDYLVSRGIQIKILCRMGHIYTDQAVRASAKFGNRLPSNLYFALRYLPNPLTVFLGVVRLVKEFKKDVDSKKILHVHDISSSILIGLVVAKIFKSPLIIQIHGFPLKALCIDLKSHSLASNFAMLLTKIWYTSITKIISFGSNLVLVNNYEVNSFYKACGINNKNLKVIPSAINLCRHAENLLSKNDAIEHLGLKGSEKDTIIGYIGSLRLVKNLETLIKAFGELIKSFPRLKAKLVIIGDGPIRPMLEKAAKKHEIDKNIFFLGSIPDAYRFLNAIDIFVLPSLSEGSPLSLIEAMAAGKAIIASNIPAIREMVEDGKEAFLFDPHNPQQLKSLILTLYNNPRLREKLGENARRKAKRYDVNVVFPKILQIYKRVSRVSANS